MWVVVILMLAAMFGYLATMDLSFMPGSGKPGEAMPAAPAPPPAEVAP